MSVDFQLRLENWGRAIRGSCGPKGIKSPTYSAMLALRRKFGPCGEELEEMRAEVPRIRTVDQKDADLLSACFLDRRLETWDRNILSLRYGLERSDKTLARRFHVGERWMSQRRRLAELRFQRIVEECDIRACTSPEML